jgi:hypothetical protein
MKVGDLVKMLPKNYSSSGIHVPDQWAGLTAIVTEDLGGMFSVLIYHPDDAMPSEIMVSSRDVEIISESR